MDIRAFIPPIRWGRRSKQPMKVYDSYECALADSHTYEDPGVIEIVSKKTEAYRKSLLANKDKTVETRQSAQNMFVLSCISYDRPLDVLEIGGACGASYFELNQLLPGKIKSWHVVETPSMADVGARLFKDEKLAFYDHLNTAVSQVENLDLLIAQGVLQYLRNPLQTLEFILNLGFAYVYITRTVVGDGIKQPIVAKQVIDISAHGPGPAPKGFGNRKTSQPITIVPSKSISSIITNGHVVLYSFSESKNNTMLIGSKSLATRTVGFLLEKVYS